MPCDSLVAAGADCSLLIHEATFEDDMAADAERKRHSTAGQVAIIFIEFQCFFKGELPLFIVES